MIQQLRVAMAAATMAMRRRETKPVAKRDATCNILSNSRN
jgi:hypothetical protein